MPGDNFTRIYDLIYKLRDDMNDGFKQLSSQISESATRISVVETELQAKASTTDLQACELRNKKRTSQPPKPRQDWQQIALLVAKVIGLLAAGGAGGAAFFN